MTNNDYIIEEMLSEKRIFRKQEVVNYRLSHKSGFILAIKKNKEDFDEIIENYEKYILDPIYKVFKLGSGEFQIMQKSNFRRSDTLWYYPINQATYYGYVQPNYNNSGRAIIEYEYFDNLEDACDRLSDYEKIVSRQIKEPVECV